MQSKAEWYTADVNDPSLDPAREAFTDAVRTFNTRLTSDPQKQSRIWQTTSLVEVQRAVLDAQQKFSQSQTSPKARKWLSKFSSRVKYYGNIMDVLAQHHPEYVSLVWGAMKFLFVAVVNHETIIASLAKGLSQIADCLPRLQLMAILYPTKRMKQAVAELYAYIVRFFIRAQGWYEEGKLRHFVHSITRPAELRYSDILDEIERCSREVDSLAQAGSQAEQRDMHTELQDLIKRQQKSDETLLEMRRLIISYQSINSSAQLDTSTRLFDLQLSQIITFTSNAAIPDPAKTLQFYLFMRDRRRPKAAAVADPFWLNPKFRTWTHTNDSSLIMVQSTFKARAEIRHFCVGVIELLRSDDIPVLWALKTVDGTTTQEPSIVDLIKSLVSQALRLNIKVRTERSLAFSCARFQSATTEDEWFALLGSVLDGMPQVYVVVDVDLLSSVHSTTSSNFSLPNAFLALFQGLADRGSRTLVKVVLVSYRQRSFTQLSEDSGRSLMVSTSSSQSRVTSSFRSRRSPTRVRGRPRDNNLRDLMLKSAASCRCGGDPH